MSSQLETLVKKLNVSAKKSLEKAAEACCTFTNYNVELEHFIFQLNETSKTDFGLILKYYEIDQNSLKRELMTAIEKFKKGNTRTPALSPHILTLLEEAWTISSLTLGSTVVRTGSLLFALLSTETLRGILQDSCPSLLKIDRLELERDLKELLRNSPEEAKKKEVEAGHPNNESALEQFTINLTKEAASGKIDPIEGRDNEIRQLIDVLMRRRQNNPILTGEAGVGKTAIVEGLALRIIEGNVPPPLKGVCLHTLDLGLLEAGAGIKGEFEKRLKNLIEEIKSSTNPIILFIDEAHTLIGSGKAAGQSDAANILKPALARGELRTIAATTWLEYKKYFEKDPALTRRFQVVKVEEPDEETAIKMLRTLVKSLEKHHGVHILEEAIEEAVHLSHKYINGRRLPDKAVSVLDTACARVALAQNTYPEHLVEMEGEERALIQETELLERGSLIGGKYQEKLQDLQKRKVELVEAKSLYQENWGKEREVVEKVLKLQQSITEHFEQGAPLKEVQQVQKEINALQEELKQIRDHNRRTLIPTCVDKLQVARVVSTWTGIPVGKIEANEVKTILDLKSLMQKRLVGQEHAIEAITKRIWTYRAHLDDPHKPVGVFLLVGPSGVGKTETALTLADILYGGEENLITINMSEYQEAHSVSNLKGAPPGYVGYGQGGVLTEAVRKTPHSVILLDEIEKAHEDVLELFYQVFDKGVLEDSEGVEVDFKNTVILLTSNVASEEISAAEHKKAPDVLVKEIYPLLGKVFPPAFLGRVITIPYLGLTLEELEKIITLKLEKVAKRFVANYQAQFSYEKNVVENIASRCLFNQTGARTVDEVITHHILPQLSMDILEKLAGEKTFEDVHLTIDKENNFSFEFKKPVKKADKTG